MLETMKGVVQRDGAVSIAMPDKERIKKRMDRLDEVKVVPENANAGRFRGDIALLHIQSPVVGIGLQAQVLLKAGGRR